MKGIILAGESVYGRHLKKVAAGEIVNGPREY